MPKRAFLLYINDIQSSCNKILTYTKNYDFEQFKKDEKTVDAVVRNLEIMGEAAKNLPVYFKKKYKNLPWKEIVAMRNKVSHEYFGVDKEILWKTVQDDVPFVKKEISAIKKNFKIQTLFNG